MNKLRYLPSIHQLKQDERFSRLQAEKNIATDTLTAWLSEQVAAVRTKLMNDAIPEAKVTRNFLTNLVFTMLTEKITTDTENNLRPVINATGVVLHTNLGRARLNQRAIEQISHIASTYSTLEFDIQTGNRGSRHNLVENYITQLTGAEAAIVVNNNAAAVYLILKAIGSGKEVIVSRGELVEIGGSFRISDIMAESAARLIAVGTTNKTHLHDYEEAITEETALLMKVHKSNFKQIGFTAEVDTEQLVPLSRRTNLPIYEDLGSGTLFDFTRFNVGSEPTVQQKVKAGIDLISFSGDKLLGGPQAGIIVGKKNYIDKLKKHPLARVLRVDKFTLAGLEATLQSYVIGQEKHEVPTVRDIVTPAETILKRAQSFIEKSTEEKTPFHYQIEKSTSKVGGGTMPAVEIETYVVSVKHERFPSTELAKQLRESSIPIIVRVQNEAVLLDFRTIEEEEIEMVVAGFSHIAKQLP